MIIKSIKLGITNCFLVPYEDRFILVDTGPEDMWDDLNKGLSKNSIGFEKITHVILTHHHNDHCGLLNKIVEENGAVRIVMSQKSGEILKKGQNDKSTGAFWLNKRVSLLIWLMTKMGIDMSGKFTPYIVRDKDILVSEDMELRDLSIDLNGKIVATAGHTTDSISIVFDDGDCLPGDTASNIFGFAGTKSCCIFMNDLDENYKSWEKLISMNVKKLYPGHGKSFGVEMLKKNMRKNKKKNHVKIS